MLRSESRPVQALNVSACTSAIFGYYFKLRAFEVVKLAICSEAPSIESISDFLTWLAVYRTAGTMLLKHNFTNRVNRLALLGFERGRLLSHEYTLWPCRFQS